VNSAIDYLNPQEQEELDAHLVALAANQGPKAHVEYQDRPEDWIVEKLGIPRETIRWSLVEGYAKHVWDGTPDPIAAILESLAAWEDVGVESATGTGKSYIAACIVYWFLACFHNSIVNTYAPKGDQLRLYIWKELTELWPLFKRLFPTATKTSVPLRIQMNGSDKWAAHGIATAVGGEEESATKAQGAHAEHMLLITEETPGMDPAVLTALRNTRTGSHNLQLSLGNPDNQTDPLHRFCLLKTTKHIVVSALDHPNVVTGEDIIPGASSRKGIQNIVGDDNVPGTPMYESRVRGRSPAQSTQALIKLEWLKAAAARYPILIKKGGRGAIGLDVANSERGDKSSEAYGIGPCLVRVDVAPCPNSNVLGFNVVKRANDRGIAPENVGVDPVGVGAGTVNEMVRLDFNAQRLGGAMSPVTGAQLGADGSIQDWMPDANLFDNLRGQMAWQLREDLRKGYIAIHPDILAKHAQEIVTPKYKQLTKVIFESKEHIIKALGGRSPDAFDSIMYWNWVRPRSEEERQKEYSDDQHPGFDYKAKKRKPRTLRVTAEGQIASHMENDLHDGRMRMTVQRWGGRTDDDDEDEDI
jgi:hypothetical protein